MLLERLAGGDAAHLIGVEHLAREQLLGDLVERDAVLSRAACARAVVVVRDDAA